MTAQERGSMYIGVSSNSSGWQITFRYKKAQHYLGILEDIRVAAIVHDIVQI